MLTRARTLLLGLDPEGAGATGTENKGKFDGYGNILP
jgi:hypothetical protein